LVRNGSSMTIDRRPKDSFAGLKPEQHVPIRIRMRPTSFLLPFLLLSCSRSPEGDTAAAPIMDTTTIVKDSLIHPLEKHFKSLKQLTFGGDNAEAYWSFDGTRLTFQATEPAWGQECDQ